MSNKLKALGAIGLSATTVVGTPSVQALASTQQTTNDHKVNDNNNKDKTSDKVNKEETNIKLPQIKDKIISNPNTKEVNKVNSVNNINSNKEQETPSRITKAVESTTKVLSGKDKINNKEVVKAVKDTEKINKEAPIMMLAKDGYTQSGTKGQPIVKGTHGIDKAYKLFQKLESTNKQKTGTMTLPGFEMSVGNGAKLEIHNIQINAGIGSNPETGAESYTPESNTDLQAGIINNNTMLNYNLPYSFKTTNGKVEPVQAIWITTNSNVYTMNHSLDAKNLTPGKETVNNQANVGTSFVPVTNTTTTGTGNLDGSIVLQYANWKNILKPGLTLNVEVNGKVYQKEVTVPQYKISNNYSLSSEWEFGIGNKGLNPKTQMTYNTITLNQNQLYTSNTYQPSWTNKFKQLGITSVDFTIPKYNKSDLEVIPCQGVTYLGNNRYSVDISKINSDGSLLTVQALNKNVSGVVKWSMGDITYKTNIDSSGIKNLNYITSLDANVRDGVKMTYPGYGDFHIGTNVTNFNTDSATPVLGSNFNLNLHGLVPFNSTIKQIITNTNPLGFVFSSDGKLIKNSIVPTDEYANISGIGNASSNQIPDMIKSANFITGAQLLADIKSGSKIPVLNTIVRTINYKEDTASNQTITAYSYTNSGDTTQLSQYDLFTFDRPVKSSSKLYSVISNGTESCDSLLTNSNNEFTGFVLGNAGCGQNTTSYYKYNVQQGGGVWRFGSTSYNTEIVNFTQPQSQASISVDTPTGGVISGSNNVEGDAFNYAESTAIINLKTGLISGGYTLKLNFSNKPNITTPVTLCGKEIPYTISGDYMNIHLTPEDVKILNKVENYNAFSGNDNSGKYSLHFGFIPKLNATGFFSITSTLPQGGINGTINGIPMCGNPDGQKYSDSQLNFSTQINLESGSTVINKLDIDGQGNSDTFLNTSNKVKTLQVIQTAPNPNIAMPEQSFINPVNSTIKSLTGVTGTVWALTSDKLNSTNIAMLKSDKVSDIKNDISLISSSNGWEKCTASTLPKNTVAVSYNVVVSPKSSSVVKASLDIPFKQSGNTYGSLSSQIKYINNATNFGSLSNVSRGNYTTKFIKEQNKYSNGLTIGYNDLVAQLQTVNSSGKEVNFSDVLNTKELTFLYTSYTTNTFQMLPGSVQDGITLLSNPEYLASKGYKLDYITVNGKKAVNTSLYISGPKQKDNDLGELMEQDGWEPDSSVHIVAHLSKIPVVQNNKKYTVTLQIVEDNTVQASGEESRVYTLAKDVPFGSKIDYNDSDCPSWLKKMFNGNIMLSSSFSGLIGTNSPLLTMKGVNTCGDILDSVVALHEPNTDTNPYSLGNSYRVFNQADGFKLHNFLEKNNVPKKYWEDYFIVPLPKLVKGNLRYVIQMTANPWAYVYQTSEFYNSKGEKVVPKDYKDNMHKLKDFNYGFNNQNEIGGWYQKDGKGWYSKMLENESNEIQPTTYGCSGFPDDNGFSYNGYTYNGWMYDLPGCNIPMLDTEHKGYYLAEVKTMYYPSNVTSLIYDKYGSASPETIEKYAKPSFVTINKPYSVSPTGYAMIQKYIWKQSDTENSIDGEVVNANNPRQIIVPKKDLANAEVNSPIYISNSEIPNGYKLVKTEFNNNVITKNPSTMPAGGGLIKWFVEPIQSKLNVSVNKIDGVDTSKLGYTDTESMVTGTTINDFNKTSVTVPEHYHIVGATLNDKPYTLGSKIPCTDSTQNLVYTIAKDSEYTITQNVNVVDSKGSVTSHLESGKVLADNYSGTKESVTPYSFNNKEYKIQSVVINGKTYTAKNFLENLPKEITKENQTITYNLEKQNYILNVKTVKGIEVKDNKIVNSGTEVGTLLNKEVTYGSSVNIAPNSLAGYHLDSVWVNGVKQSTKDLSKVDVTSNDNVIYSLVPNATSTVYRTINIVNGAGNVIKTLEENKVIGSGLVGTTIQLPQYNFNTKDYSFQNATMNNLSLTHGSTLELKGTTYHEVINLVQNFETYNYKTVNTSDNNSVVNNSSSSVIKPIGTSDVNMSDLAIIPTGYKLIGVTLNDNDINIKSLDDINFTQPSATNNIVFKIAKIHNTEQVVEVDGGKILSENNNVSTGVKGDKTSLTVPALPDGYYLADVVINDGSSSKTYTAKEFTDSVLPKVYSNSDIKVTYIVKENTTGVVAKFINAKTNDVVNAGTFKFNTGTPKDTDGVYTEILDGKDVVTSVEVKDVPLGYSLDGSIVKTINKDSNGNEVVTYVQKLNKENKVVDTFSYKTKNNKVIGTPVTTTGYTGQDVSLVPPALSKEYHIVYKEIIPKKFGESSDSIVWTVAHNTGSVNVSTVIESGSKHTVVPKSSYELTGDTQSTVVGIHPTLKDGYTIKEILVNGKQETSAYVNSLEYTGTPIDVQYVLSAIPVKSITETVNIVDNSGKIVKTLVGNKVLVTGYEGEKENLSLYKWNTDLYKLDSMEVNNKVVDYSVQSLPTSIGDNITSIVYNLKEIPSSVKVITKTSTGDIVSSKVVDGFVGNKVSIPSYTGKVGYTLTSTLVNGKSVSSVNSLVLTDKQQDVVYVLTPNKETIKQEEVYSNGSLVSSVPVQNNVGSFGSSVDLKPLNAIKDYKLDKVEILDGTQVIKEISSKDFKASDLPSKYTTEDITIKYVISPIQGKITTEVSYPDNTIVKDSIKVNTGDVNTVDSNISESMPVGYKLKDITITVGNNPSRIVTEQELKGIKFNIDDTTIIYHLEKVIDSGNASVKIITSTGKEIYSDSGVYKIGTPIVWRTHIPKGDTVVKVDVNNKVVPIKEIPSKVSKGDTSVIITVKEPVVIKPKPIVKINKGSYTVNVIDSSNNEVIYTKKITGDVGSQDSVSSIINTEIAHLGDTYKVSKETENGTIINYIPKDFTKGNNVIDVTVEKPEVKPVIKPVVKPEVKPDVKPVGKPEVKPVVKHEVKSSEKKVTDVIDVETLSKYILNSSTLTGEPNAKISSYKLYIPNGYKVDKILVDNQVVNSIPKNFGSSNENITVLVEKQSTPVIVRHKENNTEPINKDVQPPVKVEHAKVNAGVVNISNSPIVHKVEDTVNQTVKVITNEVHNVNTEISSVLPDTGLSPNSSNTAKDVVVGISAILGLTALLEILRRMRK